MKGVLEMKKIITAMGNDVLNIELKKYAKYDVILEDLICQDIVISKLAKFEADTLIISGLLQGRWNLEEFIEKIRNENNFIRIIVVTDEIDITTQKILNDLNVLDIFVDSTVEIQDIIDAIDREENIKKKYEMIAEPKVNYIISNDSNIKKDNETQEINKENIIIEKAIQKQQVIAISGVPGSGKTTIAVNLCKAISQKSECKVLLIDLDTLNGNADEILQINKVPTNIELVVDNDKKSGLNYATELIMKNRFDSNVFGELVIDVGGFDVLTGNTSLHYCQNVLEDSYYDKILNAAKDKYDFIVIDTSSNIFLDSTKWTLEKSNRVLFAIESNYISIKKMQQFLNVAVDIWGIFKKKIDIVVNKKSKNEIEDDVISKITDGLSVIGEIKLNEESNLSSYEKILSTINYIPKKSLLAKFSEMKKSLFVQNKIEKGVVVHAN